MLCPAPGGSWYLAEWPFLIEECLPDFLGDCSVWWPGAYTSLLKTKAFRALAQWKGQAGPSDQLSCEGWTYIPRTEFSWIKTGLDLKCRRVSCSLCLPPPLWGNDCRLAFSWTRRWRLWVKVVLPVGAVDIVKGAYRIRIFCAFFIDPVFWKIDPVYLHLETSAYSIPLFTWVCYTLFSKYIKPWSCLRVSRLYTY